MGNTEVIIALGVCVAVTASLYYLQLKKKQRERERLEKEEQEKKKQQNKEKNNETNDKSSDKSQKDSSSEKPIQKPVEETAPKVTNVTKNDKIEEIKPSTVNVKVDDKQNQNINKPISTSGSIEEIKPTNAGTKVDQSNQNIVKPLVPPTVVTETKPVTVNTKDNVDVKPSKVVDEPKPTPKPKEVEKPVDVLTGLKKPEPEVKKPEPEIKKPEPEVKKPEPEVKKPEPEIKKPEPEVKKPEPEVKKPEPEVKKPEPKLPETPKTNIVEILKPFNLSDTASSNESTDEIVVTSPVVPPQPLQNNVEKEQTEEELVDNEEVSNEKNEINDETAGNSKTVENVLPSVFVKKEDKKEEPIQVDKPQDKPAPVEEKKVEVKDELKDSGFGKIDLTIFYDENRSKLTINVHSASNLVNVDKNSLSDPYVRLILEPDTKKSSKQKTNVVKDSLNPKWEQIFEWTMTKAETQSKTLELSVKDEKSVFQKQETTFLGRLSIDLKNADIYEQALRKQYWLQPEKGTLINLIKNNS